MSSAVQQAPFFAPTKSQLAVAYSVCTGIARNNAKNFYYGFLVLPKPKRQAISAVYAFMRRCDDITDDPGLPLMERRVKLAAWIDSFHRAASGAPSDDPVLLALADTQRRFNIPVELLDHLAYGTEMDLQLGMNGFLVDGRAIVRATYPFLGMGIEFTDLSPNAQEQLNSMVASLNRFIARRIEDEAKTIVLPPITEPNAIIEALAKYFESKSSLSAGDFINLVTDSQQRST